MHPDRPPAALLAAALVAATFLAAALGWGAPALAQEGDPRRGADHFRTCAACHTLEPGLHTSGPSLAALFARPAGTAEGFGRYSPNLRGAGFAWDAGTLDAWLADPAAMVPGTYMDIPGMPDPQARADLIAFLEIAAGPDGAARAVAEDLIPAAWLRGVAPGPIADAPPHARVSAMRHCGDSYFITTEDGNEVPYWEKNVRLKIDSTGTGPPEGVPVIIGSGMRGDRISVIFGSLAELRTLIAEKC
ncbi:MAG TPA: c-type cytochrome [Thermohalobaculum sp.]|nr:c-type cytochrome [Thermohalobaculum sp.]